MDYLSKQQLLDYVSEKYGHNKEANMLKRIIFRNYTGKFIFYRNEKILVNDKSLADLFKKLSKE